MKTSLFFQASLIVILLFFSNCKMQKALHQTTTFEVCDVEQTKSPAHSKWNPLKSYQEVMTEKMVSSRNKIEREFAIRNDTTLSWKKKNELMTDTLYHPKDVPIRKLEAVADKGESMLMQTHFHPFVATMHLAYSKHYPMTISPDMIWLLITQGFAQHINQNSEQMRHYFVNFKGKKLININRDTFVKGGQNDWEGVFAEFSQQIEANTGADLLDIVTGNFSTTGVVEKTAFQVTLMDAMKSYFQYSLTTYCGIPEITLEGTVRDWQTIEAKAQELAQYNLDWWIEDLMPILREFTQASKGKPNQDFWQSIYKINALGSGSPSITGWILKFFPYKKDRMNPTQFIKNDSFFSNNERLGHNLTATTKDFTSGISKTDFLWNDNEAFYQMEFVAGFIGCKQDPQTLHLRPEISWAVIDKQMKGTDEQIKDYRNGGNKEYLENLEKQ